MTRWILTLLLLAAGCSLGTDLDPVSVETDAGADGDTSGDAPCETNACGGCEELAAQPGEACGTCDSGSWACDGADALTCEDDLGDEALNTCGGCGAIEEVGTSCGCGGARWVCDGTESVCMGGDGDPEANACGGCAMLPGAPDGPCGTCGSGTFRCTNDGEGLECFGDDGDEARNACGGCVELSAEPGTQCGDCGEGNWFCTNDDEIDCQVVRPELVNECGGCGELVGQPETPCGVCGTGQWACEGAVVVCRDDGGEDARNACGGCEELDHVPGTTCGECGQGEWQCNEGMDAVLCVGVNVNVCGGCGELAGSPGDACGVCDSGELRCDGFEALVCSGAEPNNVCGGCTIFQVEVGSRCGNCGTWQCDGNEELTCAGDHDLNACGGCETLEAEPNTPCGECGTQMCDGPDSVACRGEHDRNACNGCAPLDNQPGEACGQCDAGETICIDEETVVCEEDLDPLNACEGCGELQGEPGETCGICDEGLWACEGPEVTCVPQQNEEICGGFNLVEVEAGTYTRGTNQNHPCFQFRDSEHTVILTQDFRIGASEITQELWHAVLDLPVPDCPNCPATGMNYWQALAWLNVASEQAGLTPCYGLSDCRGEIRDCHRNCNDYECDRMDVLTACTGYRLPTDAEWEFATRAGSTEDTYAGDLTQTTACDPADPVLEPIAWYCAADGMVVRPVGGRTPNAWGLFDTLGNAAEWVLDGYGPYTQRPLIDPVNLTMTEARVVRGGSIASTPCRTRSASRASRDPRSGSTTIGLRVAQNAPE